MVLLQLTDRLHDRLEALSPRLPLELRLRIASHLSQDGTATFDAAQADSFTSNQKETYGPAEGRTIPHSLLVEVSKWANESQETLGRRDDFRLASLLRLTDVSAPPLPERVKSPELLAILADIQLQQDRLCYTSMTSLTSAPPPSLIPLNDPHDPAYTGKPAKTVAEEWAEIRRELGAIVNVGASMLAVATAVWWVSGGRTLAARLCLSLAGAVAIAAIEGFLYYRFFTALAAKKAREAAYPQTLKLPKVLQSPMKVKVGQNGVRNRKALAGEKLGSKLE
ncbi:hypothetical protein JCM10908_001992 [Rhodotorula pacifica]|uniref:TMEM199/VMA12 family protein n=1 Tax=Rhodotorula pacifica TaxID=1495444 RepID=UPI0031817707